MKLAKIKKIENSRSDKHVGKWTLSYIAGGYADHYEFLEVTGQGTKILKWSQSLNAVFTLQKMCCTEKKRQYLRM